MPAQKRSLSFLTIANGTLLCLNVLLLIFLTSRGVTLFEQDPLAKLSEEERENVNLATKIFEMDLHCAKDPFVVFHKKAEQLQDDFVVMHSGHSQNAIITLDTLTEDPSERTLDVTIWGHKAEVNDGISFACTYSLAKENTTTPQIKRMMLNDKNTVFHDRNADGFADVRLRNSYDNGDTQQSVDLWYQGEWQHVVETIKAEEPWRSRLADGTVMSFDTETGRWVPVEN